jgi:hypothetical protein
MSDKTTKLITIRGVVVNKKPVKKYTSLSMKSSEAVIFLNSGKAVIDDDEGKEVVARLKKAEAAKADK